MKKMMAAVFAVALASAAMASVTAELQLAEKGNKLWANIALNGIADCPTSGSVTVEFTSPNEMFESSSYEAPWKSCSKDAGQARTRAYRTLSWKSEKGKTYRAVGVWKVRVLSGDKVLAESSYEVK